MDTVIISAIVAVVVLFLVYTFVSRQTGGVVVKGITEDGKKPFTSNLDLPRSKNEKEGLTFSYTCWIRVDDFAYRYGNQRIIFTKGAEDGSTACPALLLDANTNSLLVKVDTYGATEIIPIHSIPAKKWLHVTIAVDQDSVDVFVNGTLAAHHTLSQLPKQNSETVHTGVAGGFDGKIASLEYHSFFMTADMAKASMSDAPAREKDEPEVMPPYFDTTWWTGRSRNPNEY
jgi:hypothetical protein